MDTKYVMSLEGFLQYLIFGAKNFKFHHLAIWQEIASAYTSLPFQL